MSLEPVTHVPLIDDGLADWAEALGRDRTAYRGHVYRTYNFARALAGSAAPRDDLAIVATFHDLGIWSDRTFDYLGPSTKRAIEFVTARGLRVDPSLVARSIALHHRLRGCKDLAVEAFRRADLIDLTFGLFRFGLAAAFVREVREVFPNAGFHRCLLREAVAWTLRHPLRPLPMLKL